MALALGHSRPQDQHRNRARHRRDHCFFSQLSFDYFPSFFFFYFSFSLLFLMEQSFQTQVIRVIIEIQIKMLKRNEVGGKEPHLLCWSVWTGMAIRREQWSTKKKMRKRRIRSKRTRAINGIWWHIHKPPNQIITYYGLLCLVLLK